jgi:hypothetical protein
MKNLRSLMLIASFLLIAGFAYAADPTATPNFPSPTPTPTCPPCVPMIYSSFQSFDDTLGKCFDDDGHMDAGEEIDVEIRFYSGGSCTSYDSSAVITLDNPNVTIFPDSFELGDVPLGQSVYRIARVTVSGQAFCDEIVSFAIESTGYLCGSGLTRTDTIEYHLELDKMDGEWICDQTPCGQDTPTPEPTATPTPECPETGMYCHSNQEEYHEGDLCKLNFEGCNGADLPLTVVSLIALEIYGNFYFYPSWGLNLDWEATTIPPCECIDILDAEFVWPYIPQEMTIRFWSAFIDEDFMQIIGNLGNCEIYYSPK